MWTRPFLVPLRQAGVRTVLELGCGTGNDAARLAGEGYSVTAIDLSGEAIEQAQAKFGSMARFLVADMTRQLPFPDGGFDANSPLERFSHHARTCAWHRRLHAFAA